MTLLILCIATPPFSESSGPEMAEVCLPWFRRTLKRAVEPVFSHRLAGEHENGKYFFHNRDAATPNCCVKLAAGRSPRSGLKPLFRSETHGGTPPATALNGNRRQAACRSARRHTGPRCSLREQRCTDRQRQKPCRRQVRTPEKQP